MAITTTSVTGTVVDTGGTAIEGATVIARSVTPYFYTDGALITNDAVSTTTSASGTWSLTLTENVSTSTSTHVIILYTDGFGGQVRRNYSIVVPASGPVTFASLAAGQLGY